MTDLSADAPIRLLGEGHSEKFFVDSTYAQTIYKGQPMYIDQSVDTVNAFPFVDARVVAPDDVSLGIAAAGMTQAAGASETTELEIYTAPSIIGFKSTVFTNADLGKSVYMSDSAVLSGTAADNVLLGTLFKVEDGYCYVLLTTPVICSGA